MPIGSHAPIFSFLAQIGAGTIDQAILAVLPARHQSLRLWGLVDKVLVIDEAHAYDAYMNKEIECLLEFHAALGGSAHRALGDPSAGKARVPRKCFSRGGQAREKSLPGDPHKAPIHSSQPWLWRKSRKRHSHCERIARRSRCSGSTRWRKRAAVDSKRRCKARRSRWSAIRWMRRSQSYETLSTHFQEVILFHARFAMGDRQKIEAEVLHRFGTDSGSGRNTILVATQVVEQSLDIDFDLIISDLAPVDLLIQRAGRLWRDRRGERPATAGPTFIVLSPVPLDDVQSQWPAPVLPKTNFVYKDAALLWRSAKAIFTAGKIVSRNEVDMPACRDG